VESIAATNVVSAGFHACGDPGRSSGLNARNEERAMKHMKTLMGGILVAMAMAVAGCSGSGGGGAVIIIHRTPTPTATPIPTPAPTATASATPMPSPTPIAETDFVGFVHELFSETSDTTEPADINDLKFSNLDAGPDAFNDLLK
jgi:hypothetical protein